MARVEFATENKKATTNYDYPKLKLKNGEYARILLLESPVVEYVHTLRKPQIVNGQPVMFMDERKDKTKFEANKMDFLSRPICLGDAGILDDKGSDPKNCPICALAKENSDMAAAPQRRFAMHVIRYKTKAGGTALITPYSVETLVWSFTDKTFNKIVDFKEEWGDLRKHDLTLGPCTNETFQQFDISVAAKAAWLEDDERKKLTAATFKENQIDDLSIACGSKKELKWVEEDLDAIRAAWAVVAGADASGTGDVGDLDAGIDDLLGAETDEAGWSKTGPDEDVTGTVDDLLGEVEVEADAPAAEPEAVEESDEDLLGDLLGGEEEAEAPAAKPAAKAPAKKPAAKPAAKEAPAADDAPDIDSLLADIED